MTQKQRMRALRSAAWSTSLLSSEISATAFEDGAVSAVNAATVYGIASGILAMLRVMDKNAKAIAYPLIGLDSARMEQVDETARLA
jgi:hypothetical protein